MASGWLAVVAEWVRFVEGKCTGGRWGIGFVLSRRGGGGGGREGRSLSGAAGARMGANGVGHE